MGRYRKTRPSVSEATLKCDIFRRAITAPFAYSPPPCGERMGVGVPKRDARGSPPSLTLPRKGGGKETAIALRHLPSSRLFELPALQPVIEQKRRDQEYKEHDRAGGSDRPILVG